MPTPKFHDIFEQKEKKIKIIDKPLVTADYRERNSLVASELVGLGLNVEFKELKVADYIIRDVAIERKTVSDFLSSMLNKRLVKQLEELQQYPKRLLLIEGIEDKELYNDDSINERFHNSITPRVGGEQFRDKGVNVEMVGEIASRGDGGGTMKSRGTFGGIHPNAIRGFLLSISLVWQTPIIFTKNSEDTAKFISLIAKKKETEMSLNVMKKSLNKKEQKQFILEGFPGIGPKSAKKLLKEFKSLQAIFNAGEEELKKILGKKAEPFKKIIDGKY